MGQDIHINIITLRDKPSRGPTWVLEKPPMSEYGWPSWPCGDRDCEVFGVLTGGHAGRGWAKPEWPKLPRPRGWGGCMVPWRMLAEKHPYTDGVWQRGELYFDGPDHLDTDESNSDYHSRSWLGRPELSAFLKGARGLIPDGVYESIEGLSDAMLALESEPDVLMCVVLFSFDN